MWYTATYVTYDIYDVKHINNVRSKTDNDQLNLLQAIKITKLVNNT